MATRMTTSAARREIPGTVRAFCEEHYGESGAAAFGIGEEEFAAYVAEVCAKAAADAGEISALLPLLRVKELVLARACEAGNEAAWNRFMTEYREVLYGAAYRVAKEESRARELADSVYADLYGVRGVAKLRYYSGRGSLAGWLRTVVAQQFVDGFRRTRREESLEEAQDKGRDFAAPEGAGVPVTDRRVETGVDAALRGVSPEERFLLCAYYLDGRTLAEIAKVTGVHESTVSRRIESCAKNLRKRLRRELIEQGMRSSEVDEVMERVDVRDLGVSVREILRQGTRRTAFLDEERR